MKRIVLLHGWGQHAPNKIAALADALRAKGHDVFQPHMPGFGRTDPPHEPWCVSDYAQWVHTEVATKKGWDSFVVCGHSFGGRISIALAVHYTDAIESLVLIAAAGLRQHLSFKARILRIVGGTGKAIFDLPLLSFFAPSVHSLWRRALRRKDYYRATGVMQKTFLRVIAEDLREYLPSITLPTLILWGKRDEFVPVSDALVMHEAIKNSQLKVYSQATHSLPYDSPEELADEIDHFLASN